MKFPANVLFICALIGITVLFAACDTAFQNNPHGPSYMYHIQTATVVTIAPKLDTTNLSPYGFGASLPQLVTVYGQPSKWSKPPLYAFQDGDNGWPNGSLIIATMKDGRAVEFSYVPGSDHPMTYQEAQDFAIKLLPADEQGPRTIQQENDHEGNCLAKTYYSNILKQSFPPSDFLSTDGKDRDAGSVTANFYPNASTDSNGQFTTGWWPWWSNSIANKSTVNSVLVNLGDHPSC